MQNWWHLQFTLGIIATPPWLFHLSIWALSLADADPLDISVPSHIRGRQRKWGQEHCVCSELPESLSVLLVATINVSLLADIIITPYIVFWCLEVCRTSPSSQLCACVLWIVSHCKRGSPATRNGRVFIESLLFLFSQRSSQSAAALSCFFGSD